MASPLPTAQFLSLSRTFSGNWCSTPALSPPLNYNRRTGPVIHRKQSVSSSNFSTKPVQATLSTCMIDASDVGERASTLREICQGCVPEHVLRRRVVLFFLPSLPSCLVAETLRKKKKIIAQF